MNDLRKAAEMALEALDSYPLPFQVPAKEALRQALAQPEQDDGCVAIVNEGMGGIEWLSKPLPDDTSLYTAPPKKEWVPLTDEEYDELLTGDWGGSLIRRVEARLKEKNGG